MLKKMLFVVLLVGLNSFIKASNLTGEILEGRYKYSPQTTFLGTPPPSQTPSQKGDDDEQGQDDDEQGQDGLTNSQMELSEMSENLKMNNNDIRRLFDKKEWSFFELLKDKPRLDNFQDSEKNKKALEWANQVIQKRDLLIMNYLYEYVRICHNLATIKKYLEIKFEYEVIHLGLKDYLEELGLDVYYDENSGEIKFTN